MIELEKTYLAKFLPAGLETCKYREIIDIYVPESSRHPVLRVRKNGDKYEITKKQPVKQGDASAQREQTIPLTESEFKEFDQLKGKRIHKIRYYYKYKKYTAEIDVFLGNLKGLVIIDFEFGTRKEKNSFQMPDFCLADVTQEEFAAGGMLCGKTYADIGQSLKKFGYKKL